MNLSSLLQIFANAKDEQQHPGYAENEIGWRQIFATCCQTTESTPGYSMYTYVRGKRIFVDLALIMHANSFKSLTSTVYFKLEA